MRAGDGQSSAGALEHEALDLVLRVTAGEAGERERAEARRWCARSARHADAYEAARLLWDGLGPALALARARSPSRPPEEVPWHRRRIGRRMILAGAVGATAATAAVVALRPPLQLWPSISEAAADVHTRKGEQRHVTTAAGASIDLNTRTSLNLRGSAPGAERIELLSGEAEIVTPRGAARRVEVDAAGGRTIAADARFAIRAEGGGARVTCLEGGVRVEHPRGVVEVRERQQVAYEARRLGEVVSVDPAVVTAWRRGFLVFRNEPLSRVIDEVNRYRPGRIVVVDRALGQRLVTARFRLDRIEDVVAQVRDAFGARIRTLPAGVVLLG